MASISSPVAGAGSQPSLRAAICSQAGAQALAATISMLQAFVLIPWYLHAFGPRLYGAWAASGEIFYWLQTLELGVPNILIQRIAARSAAGKPGEAGRWFGSGVVAMAALGALLGLVAWILAAPIAGWLGVEPSHHSGFVAAFRLGGCATGLIIFAYVFIALTRGLQRVRWMNAGQLAAAGACFAVTAAALYLNAGLLAIALGMCARAFTLLVFGLLAFFRETPAELRRQAGPHPFFLRELLRLAPSTAAGTAGYAAANQSDTVLAAVFLGPESAALLNVNRRLFDAIRLVADSLPQTSTGAFAWQAAQAGPGAAPRMARQLASMRTLTILPLAAAALALNRWFVGVWTGPHWDGGTLLTAGLAAGVFLAGHSYLSNALLRSTGRFRESAWLLAGEAASRWLALALAAWLGGLAWMAWAGAAVSGCAALLNRRRLASALDQVRSGEIQLGSPPGRGLSRALWLSLPLALACATSLLAPPWSALFCAAALAGSGIAAALLMNDPCLAPLRDLWRVRAASPREVN